VNGTAGRMMHKVRSCMEHLIEEGFGPYSGLAAGHRTYTSCDFCVGSAQGFVTQ